MTYVFSSHLIHSLSVLGLLFFAIADGFSVSTRLAAVLVCLTVIYTVLSTGLSTKKSDVDHSERVPLLYKTSDHNHQWFYLFFSFVFILAATVLAFLSPQKGILLQWTGEDQEELYSSVLYEKQFELQPASIHSDDILHQSKSILVSGWFETHEPIHAVLLYSSHGEAKFKLNGNDLGTITSNAASRNLFWYQDVLPGVHHLEAEISQYDLIPTVSVRTASGTNKELSPLPGPFLTNIERGGFRGLGLKSNLQSLLIALSLLMMVPVLNAWCYPITAFYSRYAGVFFSVFGFALLFILYQYLILSIQLKDFLQMEADETAFGLMSQLVLLGQSPPLFHYGQNYQGTFEAFILAYFQSLPLSTAQALKALPLFWFVLFLTITTITFWRFGSKWLGLFSLTAFLCMGIHFHWIFHKAWFGYAFGMVCGSVMWYAALHAVRFGLRPGTALLWGLAAGLSLYELPISISFVICTLGLILTHQFFSLTPSKRVMNSIVSVFFNKSMLALYAGLVLTLSPYIISTQHVDGSDSISFLVKGRTLSAPKEAGEHPFFDRFLEECFPVWAGVRQPYHPFSDLPGLAIPYFPVVLLSIAFLVFLFLRKQVKEQGILFSTPSVSFFVFMMPVVTILTACYSPFGIWSWYFIAMYWSVPVFLYALFSVGIRYTPGFAILVLVSYIVVQTQAVMRIDARTFYPASVAVSGLHIPSDFSEIKEYILNKDIHYVIADQGYDYSAGDSGRDWIGEVLSYDSNLQVISFDSHSRRLPDQAQLLMQANRTVYLFHQNFYYHNPLPGDDNYAGIHIGNLDQLFGEEMLDYERKVFSPYILYTPRDKNQIIKNQIDLEASWQYFVQPMLDHNLGIRAVSSRGYWSSDRIPADGATITLTLKQPKALKRLVLFHGTKANDYPWSSEVTCIDVDGKTIHAGAMIFDRDAHASKIDFEGLNEIQTIQVRVFSNEGNYWLTIYELWLINHP